MDIFLTVPIILLSAFLMGGFFKRFGLPTVVGQIIAGIILGLPFFESILFNEESSLAIIDFLAYLGILFLLFLAGLEIDIEKVKENSRESVLISLSSAFVPFLLGFLFIVFFFPQYGHMTALVFGGAMMITSEATKVKVLMDLNSLNTRLGAIMLAAGAIDDVFEVLFLAIVVAVAKGSELIQLAAIPLEMIIFVVVAFVAFKVIDKVLHHLDRNGNETELFSIMIIFVMLLAALSEILQIGYLIGAIISGFILQISLRGIHKRHKRDMVRVTELITLGFIVPFFFANVGLNFDIFAFFTNMPLLVATIAIAFSGKLLGTIAVKPVSGLSLKQLYYVGWAMNSRGAVELVIALIAKQYGLIPLDIFSALVAMSLVTTLAFPPVLTRGIRKNPGIMN